MRGFRAVFLASMLVMVCLSAVRADWITHGVFSERSGIDSIQRFLVLTDSVIWQDFGSPTIPLGDISGDGIEDILVVRSPRLLQIPAYSYVYYGGTPPAGYSINELVGPRGLSGTVGDVNGDGYPDLGGPAIDSGSIRFLLYFMGPQYDDSADVIFHGINCSYPVSAVDLDEDGTFELALPSDIRGGPVNIYRTGPFLDTVPDWVITDTVTSFGNTIATGDFNGDKAPDLAVSAYLNRDTSLIKFYWGGPDFDTVADYVIRSGKVRLGKIMLPLGDFNADGFDDILICGTTNEPYGIYFGGPDFDDSIDVVINWRGGYYVPTSADVAGDVNHDGYPDLIVGYDAAEELNLYLGGPDIESVMIADVWMNDLYSLPGEQDDLGYFVAGIGDFNGDGADDFVACSRTYDPSAWVGEVNFFAGWNGTATDVSDDLDSLVPQQTFLAPNYPNPFHSSTTIEFVLSKPSRVQLTVINILGQEVAHLVDRQMSVGRHYAVWWGVTDRGELVAPGVYFCRLKTADVDESRKMYIRR